MIDLKEVAVEIRDILDKKREELGLSFIEEDHIYFMLNEWKMIFFKSRKISLAERNIPTYSKVGLHPRPISAGEAGIESRRLNSLWMESKKCWPSFSTKLFA